MDIISPQDYKYDANTLPDHVSVAAAAVINDMCVYMPFPQEEGLGVMKVKQ